MIRLIAIILLALVSAAQAQNTEPFNNYLSSRASANSITGLNQLLVLQNNQVKLGSVSGLGGVLITSGITRAAIASSHIGGTVIVVSGNASAGDAGADALYVKTGCTAGGLRAIADADGNFWCLTVPLGLSAPVGWFGAVCDGVTNDAVAIQAAINEGASIGVNIVLNGSCAIGSTLTITNSVDFGGYNVQNDRLLTTAAGFNAITVSSVGPVNLHDFNISGSGANEGIHVGGVAIDNSNSRFTNLDITNVAIGIHFVSAEGWTMSQNRIEGLPVGGIGIVVENQVNGDFGDNSLWGNTIQCNAAPAVLWKSSGGFYFTGNKILGTNCTNNMRFQLASGLSTSDILIGDNSMEAATSGPGILFTRAGTTGDLFSVTIHGNEIVGGTNAISIPNDVNGAWVHQLAIVGNAVSGTPTPSATTGMIAIDSSTIVSIAYNAVGAPVTADRATVVGTGVNFAIVGPNICAATTNACATSVSSGQNTTTFAPF